MTGTAMGMNGRAEGAASLHRPDAARRGAELEAEIVALRRTLARAGLAAERTGRLHGDDPIAERAGRESDAAEARSAAAEATARHGREMAGGRADLAVSEAANEALGRANAELAASHAASREHEERLRLVLASATDYAIFSMDLDRRVTSWMDARRGTGRTLPPCRWSRLGGTAAVRSASRTSPLTGARPPAYIVREGPRLTLWEIGDRVAALRFYPPRGGVHWPLSSVAELLKRARRSGLVDAPWRESRAVCPERSAPSRVRCSCSTSMAARRRISGSRASTRGCAAARRWSRRREKAGPRSPSVV